MTSIHTQQEVTTMNELTDELLAELRTIADTATPGPWHWDKSKYHENPYGFHQDDQPLVSSHDGQWSEVLGSSGYDASSTEASSEDRAHIAAFDPPTVLALLDAVERLREERDDMQRRLDAVEARHTPVTVRYGDAPDELACRACGTHYEYPVAWPCPTVKAARGEQR